MCKKHKFKLENWEQLNQLHKYLFHHLKLQEYVDFMSDSASCELTLVENERTQEVLKEIQATQDLGQLFLFSPSYRSYINIEDWALYRLLEGIDYSSARGYYSSQSQEAIESINHREAISALESHTCECEECDFLTLGGLILTLGPCMQEAARELEGALADHLLLNEEDLANCEQCEQGYDIQEQGDGASFCSNWCSDAHRERHLTTCEMCEEYVLRKESEDGDGFYSEIQGYMLPHGGHCNLCDNDED